MAPGYQWIKVVKQLQDGTKHPQSELEQDLTCQLLLTWCVYVSYIYYIYIIYIYIYNIYNTHDYTCRYASCMHLCIYIDAHAIYLSIYIYIFVLTCKNTNILMFAEQPRRPYCSEQDRLADVFSTDIFARKGGMSEACWLIRLEDPAALSTTTWVAFGCWHGRIYAILWSLICILSGKINNLRRSFQILSWSP